MRSDDLALLLAHLKEVDDEVRDLRAAVDEAVSTEREAVLEEVAHAFEPVLALLREVEGRGDEAALQKLPSALFRAFEEIGLTRWHRPGEVLDLFPEEAKEDFILDREVSDSASLVRVEVLSSGLVRGRRLVSRPLARVLEVAGDDETEERR